MGNRGVSELEQRIWLDCSLEEASLEGALSRVWKKHGGGGGGLLSKPLAEEIILLMAEVMEKVL